MHDDELTVDKSLVTALIADQFPLWADLPLERVDSSGTVNAIYRLGGDMSVRLPLLSKFAEGIEREARWLPKLAPHLPLATPLPLAKGIPGNGYPCTWSVVKWIEGENATLDLLADPCEAATRLGEFVLALRDLDTAGAPIGNDRGLPLHLRDDRTRAAIGSVADEFDSIDLTEVWISALGAPPWTGTPTWFHGDLHSGNLLANDGRLTAVLDFGASAVGDPTIDTIAAWWLFEGENRDAFRQAARVDDDSWIRGRGWALSVALIALPYYVNTNPVFAEMSRRAIAQVLGDH